MKRILFLHGLESFGIQKVQYLVDKGHNVFAPKIDYKNDSNAFNSIAYMIKIFKPDLIVGSSMGAWISLNQFKYFKNQIKGFIGIGSAPEFLERLMWKKFPKKIKQEIISKGISIIKHGDPNNKKKQYEYPITYQLIKDGRKNKVLSKKINLRINVTMFHGQKDEAVPVYFSRKVLTLFTKAKKRIVVIKNGDHSLSNKKNLKRITFELDKIIKNIF